MRLHRKASGALLAYCKANDYTVVDAFEEPEVSGGRADNRPKLQAALDLACKRKATLVVYSLDRLARNVDDARAISKRLEKAGAQPRHLANARGHDDALREAVLHHRGRIRGVLPGRHRPAPPAGPCSSTRPTVRRMGRLDRCPFGKMPDLDGPMVPRVDRTTGETVLRPARLDGLPRGAGGGCAHSSGTRGRRESARDRRSPGASRPAVPGKALDHVHHSDDSGPAARGCGLVRALSIMRRSSSSRSGLPHQRRGVHSLLPRPYTMIVQSPVKRLIRTSMVPACS